jgi:hypothetical protein
VQTLATSTEGYHFMINSDLLRHVWMGVEELALSEGALKERLGHAAAELVTALSEPDGWPSDLLREATVIEGMMYGPPQDSCKVTDMSDEQARDVAERYWRLARRVECAVALDMANDDRAQ